MEYFGEFDADMVLLIKGTNDENLLTPEYLQLIYPIWVESLNVTMEYNGEEWHYDDLCTKAYDSDDVPCTDIASSLFGILSLTGFSTQASIQTAIDNYKYFMEVCVCPNALY